MNMRSCDTGEMLWQQTDGWDFVFDEAYEMKVRCAARSLPRLCLFVCLRPLLCTRRLLPCCRRCYHCV
jgi:hypothetical protein